MKKQEKFLEKFAREEVFGQSREEFDSNLDAKKGRLKRDRHASIMKQMGRQRESRLGSHSGPGCRPLIATMLRHRFRTLLI